MRIVEPMEFPFAWLSLCGVQKRAGGNPGTRHAFEYADMITAFDIETTRLADIEQSIMYVWQWSFGNEYVVMGRTWDDFLWFVDKLHSALKADVRLVVFVHNLSYEFAFLRGIRRFSEWEVFAVKARKILRAMWGALEFRCSYLHSNMSLDEYTAKMGVEHAKLKGFDYEKIRYPWTPLTDFEIQYCVHDVVGLVEAIRVEMAHDGDTLYTFPLTSTGYVRRDAKRAMRDVSFGYVHNQLPSLDIFEMLREAFRGGDTHANRFYVGMIVEKVHNSDRSSSYPDTEVNCPLPVSEFHREVDPMTVDEVMKLITVRGRAVVMRCAFSGLDLRDPYWPAPYLSRDKCRNIINGCYDNGRILAADYLETTLTDVDLRIVVKEYKFTDSFCYDVAHARYGKLPAPLVNETIKYYRAKTGLKGVDGQEIFYTKAKNKLNSIYGMMAQNPCKRKLLYIQDGVLDKHGQISYYPEDESLTDEQILNESNRRAFLCYQWGCWITAWARYRLREGIYNVIEQGGEFLYCDTDSVKYLGDVDWTEYNKRRIADSMASGTYADDPSGKRHYMGVFEAEPDALYFKSWGAKKYAYITMDKGKPRLHTTIAGVGKMLGAAELEAGGPENIMSERERQKLDAAQSLERALQGLRNFDNGFTFHRAGGLEAVYNDAADMTIEREGHRLHITPNVTLRPSTYTLGLAADYDRLLRGFWNESIDNY